MQQSEDQFGYEVAARILARSIDANRSLDAVSLALMATQAAVYAIILDKIREYSRSGWELLLSGLVLAAVGAALTIFVRDGPNPQAFAADFPDDPEGTRTAYTEKYISMAHANEQLWSVKASVLGLSGAMTVVGIIIATASRVGAS